MVPWRKGKGIRYSELFGSMGGGRREVGDKGREKREEENMRDQEGQVGGRTEKESKKRDTLIEEPL
ncbi:hypothetical protein [Enterococcus faecalis]